jgi:gamma-glutamyl:cysteine ligase YbdK (ATP-grasp superfamily)
MPGMDAVYTHVTAEMRQHLCDVLEQLWQAAVAQRHALAPKSAVTLLNEILTGYEDGAGLTHRPL